MAELSRLITRGKDILRQKGLASAAARGLDKAAVLAASPFYRYTRGGKSFRFGSKNLSYFIHSYNATWRNERTIEIPIAQEFLNRAKTGDRILEVGNVMAYYASFPHTVVDKYERSSGVINEDLVNFHPSEKFALAFSVSTFEHIGWDETPKEPEKVALAIRRFKDLIKPGGIGMITVPTGYNDYLDGLIGRPENGFDDSVFLQRVSPDNQWQECNWLDLQGARYDGRFQAANGLFVGYIGCQRP